ncbi:hypothetical protein DJ021_17005 [Phenylobacterium hankyongense]|uniref:YncE family protein n=1 Tax=Phenylobacterium hankyongense TaxID=1813876 RepID=A0A328B666_9CAUL|nr:hypothetical protein DJ021_17005 [Phenylobacterium hankyongense]
MGALGAAAWAAPPPGAPAAPRSVTAVAGYKLSVFAGAPANAAKSTKPDSILQLGDSVFVGYADALDGDGAIPGSHPPVQGRTEVIQYDLHGRMGKVFSVAGHNDGLMAYDAHTLWAMSNEDDHPVLTVIDLQSGSQAEYQPTTPLPHGGVDDMVIIKGVVYATASHHSVAPNGIVTGAPAVIAIGLNSASHTFDWKPVLASNAQVTHAVTGAAMTLNLTQPDSEAVAPNGDLIVDGVADSQLVIVHEPGTAAQSARMLPVRLYRNLWPLDDTRFAPAAKNAFLLFADTATNTLYRLDGDFVPGAAYSSGRGSVLKLDMSSGELTPVVIGLGQPNGMWFVTP